MKSHILCCAALVGSTVIAPAAAADAASSGEALRAVTNDFYAAYRAIPPDKVGGVPDASLRATFEPFISPALDKLLIDAGAAETAYAKKTKDQVPPLVEGDLWTSNFEGATRLKVGACVADGKKGHCEVALTYADRPPWKPFDWSDVADLVLTSEGWRIDDIEYAGKARFGNHGALADLLKWVVEEAKKPVDN